MKRLKDIDYKIISELIKNSKLSDRKLAKVLGVSQPTISRKRARFEREGLLDYTAIPDFEKFGFEIMAFSFYSWTPEANKELAQNREEILKKLSAFLSMHPNIFFSSNGRGFRMERMMISIHKSYTDYVKLMNDVNEEWGMYVDKSDSFIVSLKKDVVGRRLSFKNLGEILSRER